MNRIFLLFIFFLSPLAHAFSWQDLWLTKDQQGQVQMKQKKYKQAQQLFENPEWEATAAYRDKNYQKAATLFSNLNSENGFYNAGNAFAYLHHYQQAIHAYEQALTRNPNNEKAKENKKIIEALLKKEATNQQKQEKKHNNKNQNNEQNSKSSANENSNSPAKNNPNHNNQQKQDQKQKQQKETTQQRKEKDNASDKDKAEAKAQEQSFAEKEKQQSKTQWLRLIPDDPGGLMREKFLRDYNRRQQGGQL